MTMNAKNVKLGTQILNQISAQKTSSQMHGAHAKTQSLPTTPKMTVVQEASKTQRAQDFWATLDKPGRLNFTQ